MPVQRKFIIKARHKKFGRMVWVISANTTEEAFQKFWKNINIYYFASNLEDIHYETSEKVIVIDDDD